MYTETQIRNMLAQRAELWQKRTALTDKVKAENRSLSADERSQVLAVDAQMEHLATEANAGADYLKRAAEIAKIGIEKGFTRGTGSAQEYRAGNWLVGQLNEVRGITGASGAGAAYTPPQNANFWFDRLAAESVLLATGVKVLRTDRDSLVVPHLTADVSSAWYSEAQVITSTDMTADPLVATPRKLAAIQRLSNETLADSNPALLDVVATSLFRSAALRFDLGAFEGSGSAPEIRGLKNVSGIQSVSLGTNGAALTNLDPFADALGMLEGANAHGQAIVMHPNTWRAISKLKQSPTGSNMPIVIAGAPTDGYSRSLYGVPVFLTSQLSVADTQGTGTGLTSAYVFDPSQVYSVVRTDARIQLDSSRLFNSDESEIRLILRADLVVANPAAVVRVTGISA